MPLEKPRLVTDPRKCIFYHTMDIPGLGTQAGQWDLRGRFNEYVGNVDVLHKRVLDVGCASGYLSFAAEAAGASEVFSFDMDTPARQHLLPFRNGLYFSNFEEWVRQRRAGIEQWRNAYWLAHNRLNSRARVIYGDIYDIPQEYGQFDVVLVGSVLEHLSDPIRALASISRVASSTIVITTPALQTEEPVAQFMGDRNNPEIDYVFWVYSLGIYRHVLGMLGFELVRINQYRFLSNLLKGEVDLTVIVAGKS